MADSGVEVEGARDEQQRSFFAEPDRQMAGPDTGLAGPLEPMVLRGTETHAMYPCGISSRVRPSGNLLFPARRRIMVRVSSFIGTADDASWTEDRVRKAGVFVGIKGES
jgi:hypothetical protein